MTDKLTDGTYIRQASTGNRGYFRGCTADGKAIMETQVRTVDCDLADIVVVADEEMAAIRQIRQDLAARLTPAGHELARRRFSTEG